MIITITIPRAEVESLTIANLRNAKFKLERMGRVCYKSEDKITEDSADAFVTKICRNRHESVLEHVSFSAKFVCSRACSHQLVRHRIASYSQESQRYCDYGKRGLQIIAPEGLGLDPGEYEIVIVSTIYDDFDQVTVVSHDLNEAQSLFMSSVAESYQTYKYLRATCKPEDARYVLPNCTKTEVQVTMNARSWRHFFRERALNKHAQWEIRQIASKLLSLFASEAPAIFGDLYGV